MKRIEAPHSNGSIVLLDLTGGNLLFGGQQTVPPEFRGLSVSTLGDFLLDNPPIGVHWKEP